MIGFFSIQILIFRILRNNSDVRRRLYFELRLPVVRPSSNVEFHRNELQLQLQLYFIRLLVTIDWPAK